MKNEELRDLLSYSEFKILSINKDSKGVLVQIYIQNTSNPHLGDWCFANIKQEFILDYFKLKFSRPVNAELFAKCIQEIQKYYSPDEYDILVIGLEIQWNLKKTNNKYQEEFDREDSK